MKGVNPPPYGECVKSDDRWKAFRPVSFKSLYYDFSVSSNVAVAVVGSKTVVSVDMLLGLVQGYGNGEYVGNRIRVRRIHFKYSISDCVGLDGMTGGSFQYRVTLGTAIDTVVAPVDFWESNFLRFPNWDMVNLLQIWKYWTGTFYPGGYLGGSNYLYNNPSYDIAVDGHTYQNGDEYVFDSGAPSMGCQQRIIGFGGSYPLAPWVPAAFPTAGIAGTGTGPMSGYAEYGTAINGYGEHITSDVGTSNSYAQHVPSTYSPGPLSVGMADCLNQMRKNNLFIDEVFDCDFVVLIDTVNNKFDPAPYVAIETFSSDASVVGKFYVADISWRIEYENL